jgi:hypothetical protein
MGVRPSENRRYVQLTVNNSDVQRLPFAVQDLGIHEDGASPGLKSGIQIVDADLAADLEDDGVEEIESFRSSTATDVLNIALTAVNTGASVVTFAVSGDAISRFARKLYNVLARRAQVTGCEVAVRIRSRSDKGNIRVDLTISPAGSAEAAGRAVQQITNAVTEFAVSTGK